MAGLPGTMPLPSSCWELHMPRLHLPPHCSTGAPWAGPFPGPPPEPWGWKTPPIWIPNSSPQKGETKGEKLLRQGVWTSYTKRDLLTHRGCRTQKKQDQTRRREVTFNYNTNEEWRLLGKWVEFPRIKKKLLLHTPGYCVPFKLLPLRKLESQDDLSKWSIRVIGFFCLTQTIRKKWLQTFYKKC